MGLFTRRKNSAVALSALQSLQETGALVVNAWRKLDALIYASEDPDLTCARLVNMKRAELSPEIIEIWRYIDEITERYNRRSEHYEAMAREPAPPTTGGAECKSIMARIWERAATKGTSGLSTHPPPSR